MKILFINIGDQGGLGSASTNALRKKYNFINHKDIKLSDEIFLANALDFALAYKISGEIDVNHPDIIKIRDYLQNNNVDKIILGAHGLYDDVTHCYAEIEYSKRVQPLFTPQELANFFLDLVGNLDTHKKHKLLLSVCYAARSASYEKDHIHDNTINFLDSFAYRFYIQICQKYNFIMSARTGSIGFHTQTGHSTVSTEGSKQHDNELNEIRTRYMEAELLYNQAIEKLIAKNSIEAIDCYLNEEKYKSDNTITGKVICDYFKVQNEYMDKVGYTPLPESKYGKVIYEHNKKTDTCKIILRHKGKDKTLYSDHFLVDENNIIDYKKTNTSQPKKCFVM